MTPPVFPSDEAIRLSIKATQYKYFGDYEMSKDQWEAVDVLVSLAHSWLQMEEEA